MSRSLTTVLLGATLAAGRADAQTHTETHFDTTHTIQLAGVPASGTITARGEYFAHVWFQDPIGTGNGWHAAPAWHFPPMPPNYAGQPATFNPYGVDRMRTATDHYGAFSWPENECQLGYSASSPPCVSSTSPVTRGIVPIPQAGTGPNWVVQLGIPTLPYSTGALCEFDVAPFAPGAGSFNGSIRSAGQYGEDAWGIYPNRSYSFAWTQLVVERDVQPAFYPPAFPLQWNLATVYWGIVPTAPVYVPPGTPLQITRFYDPVSFVVTDPATGAQRSGELFQLFADLAPGGSFQGSNGSYMLDTPRGGLHVRMDHPYLAQRGMLDVEIENGVVVTSRATGYFASMVLPSIGSMGSHTINFPAPSFDFLFDASADFPNAHNVALFMGGAGAERIVESDETGAACNGTSCTSGVTAAQAASMGAAWQGAGTACPSVPYFVEEFRGGFEDIRSSGVPSLAGNCDDCGETVPLGFNFSYFGNTYSSVGLASNGYLAFSGALNVYANPSIPSASGPNGVIAAYWDDLDPLAAGDVHYATLGFAPNRRFIAQWSDVRHYGSEYRPHTFQVVLHEGSNEIEFLYLDLPPLGGAISPTAGIESPSGTAGLALAPTSLVPTSHRRFVPAPGVSCTNVSSYCTAGTSTNGCNATMSASGTPSASAPAGFVVACSGVEGQKQGLIFYGTSGSASTPWGPGSTSLLCVKAPFQRTPAQNSGGSVGACNGSLSVDLLAYFATHPGALGIPFGGGDPCWLQAWFRDPPAPKTTALSDGLQVTFLP